MLFLLIAGHALADFPLQNGEMATCKDRHAKLPLQKSVPWVYWLTAHALVHGMITAFIIGWWTGNKELGVVYGMMECAAHWIIDAFKCEGYTSIMVDQLLHVLCKALWAFMIAKGVIVLTF